MCEISQKTAKELLKALIITVDKHHGYDGKDLATAQKLIEKVTKDTGETWEWDAEAMEWAKATLPTSHASQEPEDD